MIAIDLYCGLGGWTEGLLAEGWDVIGFDNERHAYGEHRYPAQLVLQDVLTLHGAQFKDVGLIVASPPCQAYSYRAMPWKRAKALPPPDNSLFDACFRIQREASEAAGRHIPMVVENVCGAQTWVGRARWHYGSFYLWGDVPALMPITNQRAVLKDGVTHRSDGTTNFQAEEGSCARLPGAKGGRVSGWPHTKRPGHDWNRFKETGEVSPHWRLDGADSRENSGGSWFNVAHNTISGKGQNPDGRKGKKQHGSGREWFAGDGKISRETSSHSSARKAATAMIAKIPLPLARYIAAYYKPTDQRAATEGGKP